MKTTKQKMARVMLHTSTYNDEGGYIDNWEEMAQAALDVVLEELLKPEVIDDSAAMIWSFAQELGEDRLDVDPSKQECITMAIHAIQAAADRLRS
jgi:pyrroloquinoline quinone (PQQ) biosynthesis protein C